MHDIANPTTQSPLHNNLIKDNPIPFNKTSLVPTNMSYKHTMKSHGSFNEFKKQASFFFKERVKSARLALQDVTPAQLMTEEVTKGDSWPPHVPTYEAISRAAFEIDDFCRIMNVLDNRLSKFDRKNWLVSYKTLLLLEYLLIHGPLSVAGEMKTHKDVIEEMTSFQYIDHRGFNWGLRVEKLSERTLRLLGDEAFQRGERLCKVKCGAKGFGSFNQRSGLADGISSKGSCLTTHVRSDPHCNYPENRDGFTRTSTNDSSSWEEEEDSFEDMNHPFYDDDKCTAQSLLYREG